MSPVLEGLNSAQSEAVTTTEGPLLIIAGACTGKTTVITRRIAYLIEKKLAKPSEILALTFTEKAASEMEERADILVPYGYVDTWISTFHAFGNRILQENALDLGLPPDFKAMSRPSQILFFQQNLFAFDLAYYLPLGNPTKFIEAMISFISRCKDEDISPGQYLRYVRKLRMNNSELKMNKEEKGEFKLEIKKQQELANMYEKYERLKERAGLLDFGDQVSLTLKLFRSRPAVLKKYQKQFKYILIDEYQDTNFAQTELVKLLAAPKNNICVVADDDQSIYRFRGAAISNVLDFKKTYKKSKVISLVENYRSTQGILDAAYRLIRHNDPDRLEVAEKISKKLVSANKNLGFPKEIYADTLSSEADLVAEEIKKLTQKYQYKDIAILVRANSQADPFLRSLNMKGIPHKFVGSSGLYVQPEIRVLIAFLSSLVDIEDSLQIYHLATSEIYSLSMDDAAVVSSYAKRKGRSLGQVFRKLSELGLEISKEGKKIIEKMLSDLDEMRQLSRKQPVGKVLYEFLQKSRYLENLSNTETVEAQTKVQNIAKFFEKIGEFSLVASSESVATFIEWLQVMRSVGDDPATAEFDPDTDAVNVMSIHAAKGLEFSVVFLVNLVSDLFPSRDRKDPISIPDKLIKETLPLGDFHIQEERRLFYVGSTRAKEKLYLTWSRDMGGKRIKKISPFVLEALDKVVSDSQILKPSPLEKISGFAKASEQMVVKRPTEPKILKLTQGSIDDYRTCAYKYRYIHVLRLPILRHHAVVYGSALHEAVAAYYRAKMNGKKITLNMLLQGFENAWDSEGFLSAEHEQKRLLEGKKVLKDFWKREAKKKDMPKYIEKGFRFDVQVSGNRNSGVLVRGRYDRVDEDSSGVKIIDFKTTAARTREEVDKAAVDSLQLKIYALAYYKNYKKIPRFVGIYDLETGIIGGFEPPKKVLEETEELIIEAAKNIRKNHQEDTFPANPIYFGRVPACNYCAYSSICPFSIAKN